MKNNNKKSTGLKGGPNEYVTHISQFTSIDGYKADSPDVNNPYNIIESGNITMEGVEFPVVGTDNLGNQQTMFPGMNYQFPGDTVYEVPLDQDGPKVKQRRGVRENADGSVSSHLMKAEYVDGRGWVGFPSLFQDSKPYADDQENWHEVSEENGWWPIYQEAVRRGEVYDFGEDKEAALAFGKGSWKDQLPEQKFGGSLPKAQKLGEIKPEKIERNHNNYKYIPEEYFTIPTGDFTYNKKSDGVLDENGKIIYEDLEMTGTYNPDWFTQGFDAMEYYKGDQDNHDKYEAYNNNPYMVSIEDGSDKKMNHPLSLSDSDLNSENTKRYNNELINEVYDEQGNVRPEFNNKIGSQKYLYPFAGDGFNEKEGRFISESRSDEGWYNNYNKLENGSTTSSYVKNKDGSPGFTRKNNLTKEDLIDLYDEYKDLPGFGGISKKEYKNRLDAGDMFLPQVFSREQKDHISSKYKSLMNPVKPDDIQMQKDFLRGGINSDLYKEKVIYSGYERPEELITNRLDALKNVNVEYSDDSKGYGKEFLTNPSEYSNKESTSFDPNWAHQISDKMGLLSELYKRDKESINTGDIEDIMFMSGKYTPFPGETTPSSNTWYKGKESDMLIGSRFEGSGMPRFDDYYNKLIKGEMGSRSYPGASGENKGRVVLDPRQAQGMNIESGFKGTPDELFQGLSSTNLHEMSHMVGSTIGKDNPGDIGLNKTDQDKILNLMVKSGVDLSTLDEHDAAPSERKADMDAMRYDMFNTIGYDYRTTQMTPEILKRYKQYRANNPKPGLSESRTFEFFNDESIIEFNNTVADLNIGIPEDIAKNGKELPKAQNGIGGYTPTYEDSLDLYNNSQSLLKMYTDVIGPPTSTRTIKTNGKGDSYFGSPEIKNVKAEDLARLGVKYKASSPNYPGGRMVVDTLQQANIPKHKILENAYIQPIGYANWWLPGSTHLSNGEFDTNVGVSRSFPGKFIGKNNLTYKYEYSPSKYSSISEAIKMYPKPSGLPTPPPVKLIKKSPNYNTDIVAYLKREGLPSTYAHRKKLAIANGIEDYNGSAKNNIALLDMIKNNALSKEVTTPKGSTKDVTTEPIKGEKLESVPRHIGGYSIRKGKNPDGEWDDAYNQYRELKEGELVRQYGNHIQPGMMTDEMMKRVVPLRKYGGSLPKAQNGIGEINGGILSYKNNSDWFDGHTVYNDNATYDNMIRQKVYAGTHGYDPKTQMLHELPMDQQVSVHPQINKWATTTDTELQKEENIAYAKNEQKKQAEFRKGKVAHRIPTEDAWNPYGPEWAGKTVWLTPEDQQKVNEEQIQHSNRAMYKNPIMYAPGAIAAGMFALPALAALGEAAYVSESAILLGNALRTSIPGIEGATLANAVQSTFAADFIVNRAPEIPGQVQRGEYGEAALNTGMGILDLIGVNAFSPLQTGAKMNDFMKTVNKTGKYLTEETILKDAYKLNPKAEKDALEKYLYRARPIGQDPSLNMAEKLKIKQESGEELKWFQKNLLNKQTDPSMLAREKYFGQWFADNPSALDHYINPSTRNFDDAADIEILRQKVSKAEAGTYNVKNFEDAKKLSNLHDTEFILPKNIVQGAERFPESSLQKLIAEDKAFNTPHWLKGYKKIDVPNTPTSLPGGANNVGFIEREMPTQDFNIEKLKSFIFGQDKGSSSSRSFFEKFPITNSQKQKVIEAQNRSAEDGMAFLNEYLTGSKVITAESKLLPSVKAKMDRIVNSDPTSINKEAFRNVTPRVHNPLAEYKNKINSLVNDDGISNMKVINGEFKAISKEDALYIKENKGRINGVNTDDGSITLRNNGRHYNHGDDIMKVAVHEGAHTMQKIKPQFHKGEWNKVITKYDPKTGAYYQANDNTKLGEYVKNAMVEINPTYGIARKKAIADGIITERTLIKNFPEELKKIHDESYKWLASPHELHSELMAAKAKMHREVLKTEDYSLDWLRDIDDKTADKLLKIIEKDFGRKFFKASTPHNVKRYIIKFLPAAVPATIGAASFNGEKNTEQFKRGGGIPKAQTGNGEYKVKSGDTFYGIANKNNISKEELTRLNPGININSLKLNQNINLVGAKKIVKSTQIDSNKKNGLTNDLLMKQAYKESTFNPSAESPAGYKGLTQIGKAVISDYNKVYKDRVINPFNMQDAVDVQRYAMENLYNASFIDKPNQLDQVRIAKTLASYNWGRGHVEKYLTKQKKAGADIYNSLDWTNDLPKETRDYINKILLSSDEGFEKDYTKAIENADNKKYLELYGFKKGGETDSNVIYKNYINGIYNGTSMEKKGMKVYDKLNRMHYKDSKVMGMTPANYVLTYIAG